MKIADKDIIEDVKKIFIVTAVLPPHYGGADIAALRYAQALAAMPGYEVKLVGEWNTALDAGKHQLYPFLLPVHWKRLPHWKSYFRHLSHYLTWINCFFSTFLVFFKNRHQFELIHCFNSSSNLTIAAILAGKILGKRVVTETSLMHSDDPVSVLRTKGIKSLVKVHRLKGRIFLMADYYISKSPYITAAYHKKGLEQRCLEIPYFIDSGKFYPASFTEKKGLRDTLKLPATASIILFVGGINPRKGVHILVEAFQQIMADFPAAFLLLVGPTDKYDPTYPAQIEAAIAKSGSEKARLVAGNSTIVDQYMRASDIYCLPSFREGFPISNIEAMAAGLAVVASDIPEIKDNQIRDGENGLVFSTGSSEDLALKLASVLRNDVLRQSLVKQASEEAETKYNLSHITQRYLECYRLGLNKRL